MREIDSDFYTAYGLNICSALPLPELISNVAKTEVNIMYGHIDTQFDQTSDLRRHFGRTDDGGVQMFWQGVGTFLVREGKEIIIHPDSTANEQFVRLALLGPALGILLYQRGLLVFHSSAVAGPRGAVAFMAHKGQGKSTMATAFYFRGFHLLADDIMAVDDIGDQLLIEPAFPQTKLWPEAIEALGESPNSLPQIRPDMEKRSRTILQGFAEGPRPLCCIFLLSIGQDIEILPLRPQNALLNVLPHWYGAAYDGEMLEILGSKIHFQQCLRLVRQVPVYILKRPPSLARLPEVTYFVEEFLAKNFPEIDG